MKLNQIILEKRKELGYTQEQIANYLGISTPAVNKWERGISFPDISLLAPLARLLKTDVNTLLSFQEELTQNEITRFCNEVKEGYETDGFDRAYEIAQEKFKQYPKNMKLIHNMALMLDGLIFFSGMPKEQRDIEQEKVFVLYEQLFDSEDIKEKNSAAFMLSSKYIASGKFEKAQEMIDILPEFNAMDKRVLQANLYVAEEKYKEATEIHETILMMDAVNVWNHLLSLQGLKWKQKQRLEAEQIANIAKDYATAMELPEYYRMIPLFQQAVFEKDTDKSISLLKQLITATKQIAIPLNSKNSVLYRESAYKYKYKDKNKENKGERMDILPALFQEMNDNEEYAFLRESPKYQKILSDMI